MRVKIWMYFVISIIILYGFSIADSREIEILEPNPRFGRTNNVAAGHAIVRLKYDIRFDEAENLFGKMGFKILKQVLKPEQSLSYQARFHFMPRNDKYTKIVRTEQPLLRSFVLSFDNAIPPETACEKLRKEYLIELAEPYYVYKTLYVPSDPLAESQETLKMIKAFKAFDHYRGDTSVVIGISDNGVLQQHEDLFDNIAPNYLEVPDNDVDDDGNGYIDDYMGYNFAHEIDNTPWGDTYHIDGHGTSVAGIAAADFDNGKGMTGTAGHCRIFPMKTAEAKDNDDILFGYESIFYAGIREFEVLNCSWGAEKEFSDFEQSIVDFAMAHGVAVVASAGNSGDILPYYPAGYFGVLGVGEVNEYDNATGSSAMGAHTDIMAPGMGNFFTTNSGSYDDFGFGGTSAAAPVASGVVALVRGKYPYLDAYQALELVRQSTDNIVDDNYTWREVIPGRINAEKAVIRDPFSIPGIRPSSHTFSTIDGDVSERFSVGSEVLLDIHCINHLGAAENLTFKLTPAEDYIGTITVMDSLVELGSIDQSSEFGLGTFRFVVNEYNMERIFLRIDIEGQDGYEDFFLLPFVSDKMVTTFENEKIKYSAGDYGTLGFAGSSQNPQGVGFVLKGYRNQLFKSGLMASEGNRRIVSAYNGSSSSGNDFSAIKGYLPPDKEISIINDSEASSLEKIGLEIRQEHVLQENSPVSKIMFEVRNISGGPLYDVSFGYYFDWDISNDISANKTELFPEAIPPEINGVAAAELAYAPDSDSPFMGAAAFSKEESAEPQAAGLDNSSLNFSKEERLESLNSGISLQYDFETDISAVVGMKFPGEFENGDTLKFSICFGGAETRQALADALSECLDSSVNSVGEKGISALELTVAPNPTDGIINISAEIPQSGPFEIAIYDILGSEVLPVITQPAFVGEFKQERDISRLSPGIYIVVLRSGGKVLTKRINLVK